MKIAVIGAAGRLGSAIVRLAEGEALPVGREGDLVAAVRASDVVIDVSHHSVTGALVAAATLAGKPLVVGTTGHPEEGKKVLRQASEKIPVLLAPNFSVGINLLSFLTRKAAEVLGPGYDQEIFEMHHRYKKDAPSGTARRLAEVLCEVKGKSYAELVRDGRSGEGERTADEIGLHALRGGDVIGDHTVLFAGIGERIELTHKASTRDTFALGALRAARWLAGKPAGWYGMDDVLGLHI